MRKLLVNEIWIYPVKSLGGIRMQSAKVFPKGLEYDRRWMLIDSGNRFMTQRTYPELALFKLFEDAGNFIIRHFDQSITLSFDSGNEIIPAVIWNDTVNVYEVSKRHSDWFSEILGVNCRLVSFPEDHSRPVDPVYAVGNDHVSLADAYPLLIIGQRSLDDLNSRLSESLPMNRFRPNVVFTGGDPYEEDDWRHFRIGRNSFVGVKPCSRCVTTTINQDTAKKGIEPLATLSTYRMRNNKVYFGQNIIPLDHYQIAEGDEILLNIE